MKTLIYFTEGSKDRLKKRLLYIPDEPLIVDSSQISKGSDLSIAAQKLDGTYTILENMVIDTLFSLDQQGDFHQAVFIETMALEEERCNAT